MSWFNMRKWPRVGLYLECQDTQEQECEQEKDHVQTIKGPTLGKPNSSGYMEDLDSKILDNTCALH